MAFSGNSAISGPSIALWALLLGTLLIVMVLAAKPLARVLLSSAMVYLLIGFALGPAGFEVVKLDPTRHAATLERVAEVALLISLFTVGLRMGNVPLRDRRWMLPVRLAFVSMAITVALIAAVGVWLLGLPLGGAVLLGAILAPTDPVLASGVKTEGGTDPGLLRFGLAGEGGLNDGSAFPFVLLGLGLLGAHDLGPGAWRWWIVDLLWATAGGLLVGASVGMLVGRLVVHLRTRHDLAHGRDEFLSLGLVALAYGAAQLVLASGFLAVFAAGLALQQVREPVDPDPGSTTMTDAVQGFNEQLEKLAELAIVLLVGIMLPYAGSALNSPWTVAGFVLLLFLVLRPLAVLVGTQGEPMAPDRRLLTCWFGIRGIGSIYYLLYALHHGLSGDLAPQLITLTLVTVAASVVVHGISVRPLMSWYLRHKRRT